MQETARHRVAAHRSVNNSLKSNAGSRVSLVSGRRIGKTSPRKGLVEIYSWLPGWAAHQVFSRLHPLQFPMALNMNLDSVFRFATLAVVSLASSTFFLHNLVADETSAGWVSLFNGTNLDGWKHDELGKAEYSVVDGAVHGVTVAGSPNSFLYTEKEFGDFELEFEVKVHDSLNSGVQIRSRPKSEADAAETDQSKKSKKANSSVGRFFGPQVEIESSPGQAGYIYGEATGLNWLSEEPQIEGFSHTHMRNGEWNKFRVVAKGPRIQTWINNQSVADLTHETIFKTHPKGHIALQVHGVKAGTGPYDVSWRNIRIREVK
jgi:hypothetical protein